MWHNQSSTHEQNAAAKPSLKLFNCWRSDLTELAGLLTRDIGCKQTELPISPPHLKDCLDMVVARNRLRHFAAGASNSDSAKAMLGASRLSGFLYARMEF